jgi:Zn-dependent M28 family amino/carboxypeptidase
MLRGRALMNAFGSMLLLSALAINAASDDGSRAPMQAGKGVPAAAAASRGAAAAVVSRDSLVSMVHFLSTDPATGQSRTRFTLREEPLRLVADSLAARLSRYTGFPVERFSYPIDSGASAVMAIDSSYTAEDLIARLPGNGQVAGVFLVTAHFDAIGLRTPGWTENWRTWAAPGADDNGTGVATVLEAARILSRLDLPFDVMFVLFSGEELGLLGSEAFVSALPGFDTGRIIGVLNCDMIGYPFGGRPAGTVVSNPFSDWLSDLIVESAAASDPSFPLAVLSPGPSNSDHAPFWRASIPGVMFVEPLRENMLIGYPYYHTLADTLGNVDFEQVERMANIVVTFIDRISTSEAEAELLPSDLVLLKQGYPNTSRAYAVGDTMIVRAVARNRGSAPAPLGSSMRFTISIENGSFARTLRSEVVEIPDPLDADTIEANVVLDRSFVGAAKVRATISVGGMDDDASDNTAEVWMSVEGEEALVLMHAVQPNPVSAGFRSASFCVNLARGVDIGLSLYTLEGERVGTAFAGSRWGEPLHAGMNCLALSDLFPRIGRLASGLYLYRLVLYEGGAKGREYAGRFAVQE